MNEIQNCVGIDITYSKLQFVEIERRNNSYLVENLGQTYFSPQVDFKEMNESTPLDQLQTAYQEIVIRHPIKSNFVSFTLPQELFITVQLPYDANLTHDEIKEEFNWELSQLFPFVKVDELAIKFYELNGTLHSGKNNALIVALNKKYLMLIKSFCQKNNLTPKLVDSSAITANGFINNFINGEKRKLIHLFNSRHSISLFINIESKPSYVKVFPKQDEKFLSKIIYELTRENIRAIITNPSVKALITGEDLESELISEIGRATELVFERINPFEILKFKSDFKNTEIIPEQFGSFISSAAIATRF